MRTIDNTTTELILGGELGEKYGRTHHLVINTPVEALRMMAVNFPQFKQDLIKGAEAGLEYQIVVDDERSVGEKEMQFPIAGRKLFFGAVTEGAKNGGIFQTIAGVIVLAIAYFNPGGYITGPAATAAMYGMGVSLVFGGITSLLTTVPKSTGAGGDTLSSYYFNGPVNTQQQGLPVPVVYGRVLIGSTAISASMQAVDLASAPSETGNRT